jgi:hypothetical protein
MTESAEAERGCICITHYNEAGYGVIPRILPACPYHQGVHPLRRGLRQEDALRLLRVFVPVVRMYVTAFASDELMSLTEKLALQDVEEALAEYDALLLTDGETP